MAIAATMPMIATITSITTTTIAITIAVEPPCSCATSDASCGVSSSAVLPEKSTLTPGLKR